MSDRLSLSRRVLLGAAASFAAAPALAQGEAIHVRTIGEDGAAWILIHPFSASGRFWERRAPLLAAEHNVRVVSPDMPSHGRSALVQRFTYDSAADAIERALAPHRDATALILGASSGALVAMKVAARWGKPVVAVGAGLSFSAANVASMQALARATPEGGDAFAAAFREQGEPQRAAIQRHFGDLASLGEAPLVSADECAALAGRALIINGANDDFFLPPSAHALAQAIPNSVLSFVTGAGHLEPFAPQHAGYTWASAAALARTRGA